MNDLIEAYGMYQRADGVLDFIVKTKEKSIKRTSLKKNTDTKMVIELLKVYGLISISGEGKQQRLEITEKGITHLQGGGFRYSLLPIEPERTQKTFKQHLDDITGLLTVFGILNAVILFANQIRHPNVTDPTDLNLSGTQFISISMYLLSIMVLWEIIWVTLNETQDTFKFKALYLLLCTTTIGVGCLFLNEYLPLIYVIAAIFAFFGIVGAIFWLLLQLLPVIVTPKNGYWFKKHWKKISFAFMILSMILATILLMLFIFYFKNSQ